MGFVQRAAGCWVLQSWAFPWYLDDKERFKWVLCRVWGVTETGLTGVDLKKQWDGGQFLGVMEDITSLAGFMWGFFFSCFVFFLLVVSLFSLMVCMCPLLVCWLSVLVEHLMFYSFQRKMTGGARVKARGQQNLFPSFYDLQHIWWLQLIIGSMARSSFYVDCGIHQYPGDEMSKLLPSPKVAVQNGCCLTKRPQLTPFIHNNRKRKAANHVMSACLITSIEWPHTAPKSLTVVRPGPASDWTAVGVNVSRQRQCCSRRGMDQWMFLLIDSICLFLHIVWADSQYGFNSPSNPILLNPVFCCVSLSCLTPCNIRSPCLLMLQRGQNCDKNNS